MSKSCSRSCPPVVKRRDRRSIIDHASSSRAHTALDKVWTFEPQNKCGRGIAKHITRIAVGIWTSQRSDHSAFLEMYVNQGLSRCTRFCEHVDGSPSTCDMVRYSGLFEKRSKFMSEEHPTDEKKKSLSRELYSRRLVQVSGAWQVIYIGIMPHFRRAT